MSTPKAQNAEYWSESPRNAAILKNSRVSAVAWERFTVTDDAGKPATFAILNADGKVLDSGAMVGQEIWDLAILSYRRYLIGEGALRIYSGPEGLTQDVDE